MRGREAGAAWPSIRAYHHAAGVRVGVRRHCQESLRAVSPRSGPSWAGQGQGTEWRQTDKTSKQADGRRGGEGRGEESGEERREKGR
eukprot:758784-Hanusia_phi.AAC.1